MKSQEELEKLLALLEKSTGLPCNCNENTPLRQQFECEFGRKLLASHADLLRYILGDPDNRYGGFVELVKGNWQWFGKGRDSTKVAGRVR